MEEREKINTIHYFGLGCILFAASNNIAITIIPVLLVFFAIAEPGSQT
jgi:VanZ family protein